MGEKGLESERNIIEEGRNEKEEKAWKKWETRDWKRGKWTRNVERKEKGVK